MRGKKEKTKKTTEEEPSIVYAGDRDIAVRVVRFLLDKNVKPKALFISSRNRASHDSELVNLCSYLSDEKIFRGSEFRKPKARKILREINLDYILSIHFPYIYPSKILDLPEHGVINLHPAYLPYNRGWHTPTWAIWEETPYGATLHFMNEEVDAGDIIARKKIEIRPEDTADSLYSRVKELEFDLFKETWPSLASFTYNQTPQSEEKSTQHTKEDIQEIQKLDLEKVSRKDFIRRLRSLTTNKIEEAAYFLKDGRKYRIQVRIVPEDSHDETQ